MAEIIWEVCRGQQKPAAMCLAAKFHSTDANIKAGWKCSSGVPEPSLLHTRPWQRQGWGGRLTSALSAPCLSRVSSQVKEEYTEVACHAFLHVWDHHHFLGAGPGPENSLWNTGDSAGQTETGTEGVRSRGWPVGGGGLQRLGVGGHPVPGWGRAPGHFLGSLNTTPAPELTLGRNSFILSKCCWTLLRPALRARSMEMTQT